MDRSLYESALVVFEPELIEKLKALLNEAQTITILTHINPDADTLGTGLGIFVLLKKHLHIPIEIVNTSKELPHYLDFLPAFHRIKHRMDFEKGLVITCDGGSIDRFGVELEDRTVINIDHHQSNTRYGSVNIVMPYYASASQVALRVFERIWPITQACATCFYTALLSDTRYFTTSSVNDEVFKVAALLIDAGAKPAEIAAQLRMRRSLASLRILERALHSLTLYMEGKVGVISVTPEDIKATGARMPDMDGLVDYALSLAVVEVAVLCIVQPDGEIRVSLRSKGGDVAKVASRFGGGGHTVAAGFTVRQIPVQELIDTILQEITTLGLTDGKKK